MKKTRFRIDIVLFLFFCLVTITSCDQEKINPEETTVKNDIPSYSYSASIYDKNNTLLSQNIDIVDISNICNVRLQLKNMGDSPIDLCFCVLINGIMIDISANDCEIQDKIYCFSLGAFENIEIEIRLFPEFLCGNENKVSFVFISEFNEYYIDEIESLKNYTSSLSVNVHCYSDTKDYLKDQVCDTEYESIPLSEYGDGLNREILTETIGESVCSAIMPHDDYWFLYQPHKIYINTEAGDSFENFTINLFASEGEYVTMLFAEGVPIPAFNGKYYLYWKTDGNSLITSYIKLSEQKPESINNIFTITVPLDIGNTHIYDSDKTNVYNWDQNSRSETKNFKSYIVKLSDNNGTVYKPDLTYDYSGGSVTYKYTYYQKNYCTVEKHRIMVMINGFPQFFYVGDSSELLYYDYTVDPSATKEIFLKINPRLKEGDSEFNISIVTLFNCEANLFNESSMENTSLIHRMGVHYSISNASEINIQYSNNDNNYILIDPISVVSANKDDVGINLYNDFNALRKSSSSQYVFIPSEENCSVYIEISNYDVSSYSLVIICNGELIEFGNGSKTLSFEINQSHSVYKFRIDIPSVYIKKHNSLLFVISKGQKNLVSYNELNRRCSCALRLSVTTLTNFDCEGHVDIMLHTNSVSTEITVNNNKYQHNNICSTTVLADTNKVTEFTPRIWYESNSSFSCTDSVYIDIVNSPFYFMNCLLINSFDNNESIIVAKYKTYRDGITVD